MPETVTQPEQLKMFDERSIDRSVVDLPNVTEGLGLHPFIMSIASAADGITDWSVSPKARDTELRKFWHTEPMLAGVIFSTVARNAGLEWEIVPSDPRKKPPKNTINQVTRWMTSYTEHGQGWIEYRSKIMLDLLTQDNGAFHEVVRLDNNDPTSPVIALNHLDSGQCMRTGDPEVPVVYTTIKGREIRLYWWQVITDSLFPAAKEDAYGVQYSPLTLALLAAQVLRDIAIYKKEKVSGGNSRAIHFVSNVTRKQVQDAKTHAVEADLNRGLIRYSDPIIVHGLDPQNTVQVATLPLASLPDAFDEDSTFKWYIVMLANAMGIDYQEIAPLPGGGLGSGSQSEIQHMKSQGKGPALAMRKGEHIYNNSGVLPSTVKYQYKQPDLLTNRDLAEAAFTRSKKRSMDMQAGYLDPRGALELAVYEGDIPEHIAEGIIERGLAEKWYMNRFNNADAGPEQVASAMENKIDPENAD